MRIYQLKTKSTINENCVLWLKLLYEERYVNVGYVFIFTFVTYTFFVFIWAVRTIWWAIAISIKYEIPFWILIMVYHFTKKILYINTMLGELAQKSYLFAGIHVLWSLQVNWPPLHTLSHDISSSPLPQSHIPSQRWAISTQRWSKHRNFSGQQLRYI